MRYGIFLLLLEGVCIFILSLYGQIVPLFPTAILIAYLFVLLLCFFPPTPWSSLMCYHFVFLCNLFLLVIAGFFFYHQESANSSRIQSNLPSAFDWKPLMRTVSSPSKDEEPFLRSLQSWVFYRYAPARYWGSKLTGDNIRRTYLQAIHEDEKHWEDKKRQFLRAYPSMKKAFYNFNKGRYNRFQQQLAKLSYSPIKKEFLDITKRLSHMMDDMAQLEKELMTKHFKLLSRYHVLLPTLRLLPQTAKLHSSLFRRLGVNNDFSLLDIFTLQAPRSGFLMSYTPLVIPFEFSDFKAQRLFLETRSNLLIVQNAFWQGKIIPWGKVVPRGILRLTGHKRGDIIPIPFLRTKILSYDSHMANRLYYRWFFPSFILENKVYYEKYIRSFQEQILFFLSGFILSSLLVRLTGAAFGKTWRVSFLSFCFGFLFSLFLTVLFYETIVFLNGKILSFWF